MKLVRIYTFLILFLLPLNLQAELNLNPCSDSDIKGNFNLIIYSNSFINDPETFIILEKIGSKIMPYAPGFKYRTIENLTEKEALRIANEILKDPSFVSSIKCSAIYDEGNIRGYELKPIYFPWIFGIMEPVETVYKKQGDAIVIFIKLDPRVERQLYFGENSDEDN